MIDELFSTKLQKHGFILADEEEQLWILSGDNSSISFSVAEESCNAIASNNLTGEIDEQSSEDFDEVLEWSLKKCLE